EEIREVSNIVGIRKYRINQCQGQHRQESKPKSPTIADCLCTVDENQHCASLSLIMSATPANQNTGEAFGKNAYDENDSKKHADLTDDLTVARVESHSNQPQEYGRWCGAEQHIGPANDHGHKALHNKC